MHTEPSDRSGTAWPVEHGGATCTGVGDAHDSIVGERSEACGDRFWRRLRRMAAIFLMRPPCSLFRSKYLTSSSVASALSRPPSSSCGRCAHLHGTPIPGQPLVQESCLRDSWHHPRRWLYHGRHGHLLCSFTCTSCPAGSRPTWPHGASSCSPSRRLAGKIRDMVLALLLMRMPHVLLQVAVPDGAGHGEDAQHAYGTWCRAARARG